MCVNPIDSPGGVWDVTVGRRSSVAGGFVLGSEVKRELCNGCAAGVRRLLEPLPREAEPSGQVTV